MIQFKSALASIIEEAKERIQYHLTDEYEVTLIFHTSDGNPEDAGVVSTGDPTHALPAVSDAAGEQGVMEEV